MTNKFLGIAFVIALLLAPRIALSHGGRLDSLGCHNNNKNHTYECHHGPLAGKVFPNKAAAEAALKAMQKN